MGNSRTGSTSACEADQIKLLMVDDDELYRVTIQEELEEMGFLVEGFSDGEALLARLGGGSDEDVIVLDWELDRTQGIDLLLQLRERGVDTPVVFLTARNSPIHESLAFNKGADDFVDKARGIEILATRLRRVVANNSKWSHPARLPAKLLPQGEPVLKSDVNVASWYGNDVGLTLTQSRRNRSGKADGWNRKVPLGRALAVGLACLGAIALVLGSINVEVGKLPGRSPMSSAQLPTHQILTPSIIETAEIPVIDPTAIPPREGESKPKVSLSKDQVWEVQAWLRAYKLDPGPIDGLPGPRTFAAVKTFEAAHQRPETGNINYVLLAALRLESGLPLR